MMSPQLQCIIITCWWSCLYVSPCWWHTRFYTHKGEGAAIPSVPPAPAHNPCLHLPLPRRTLRHPASFLFCSAPHDLLSHLLLAPSRELSLLLFPHVMSVGPTWKISAPIGTVPSQTCHECMNKTVLYLQRHVLHGTEVTGQNRGSQDPLFLKGQLSGAVALWVILSAVGHTQANQ